MIIQRKIAPDSALEVSYCFRILENNRLFLNGNNKGIYTSVYIKKYMVEIAHEDSICF